MSPTTKQNKMANHFNSPFTYTHRGFGVRPFTDELADSPFISWSTVVRFEHLGEKTKPQQRRAHFSAFSHYSAPTKEEQKENPILWRSYVSVEDSGIYFLGNDPKKRSSANWMAYVSRESFRELCGNWEDWAKENGGETEEEAARIAARPEQNIFWAWERGDVYGCEVIAPDGSIVNSIGGVHYGSDESKAVLSCFPTAEDFKKYIDTHILKNVVEVLRQVCAAKVGATPYPLNYPGNVWGYPVLFTSANKYGEVSCVSTDDTLPPLILGPDSCPVNVALLAIHEIWNGKPWPAPPKGYALNAPGWNLENQYRATAAAFLKATGAPDVPNANGYRYTLADLLNSVNP